MAPRRAVNQPPGEAIRVTGPSSAMTAFLREQGITANRGRMPARAPVALVVAPTINEDAEESTSGVATPDSAQSDPTNANATASGSGTSTPGASGKKRKSGEGIKESAAAMKKKKYAEKAEFDKKNASSAGEVGKPGRYDNRAPGAISKCGECGKRFTVTKYTTSNRLPSGGLLCSPCATELGQTAPAEAVKPKPKVAPKKKAVKVVEKENRVIRTLQGYCLDVIGKHIADVEALGDIGQSNLDKIAKIVSKHRALNSENLKLFLDIGHRELTLYDCTNITAIDLAAIASFCPHLERLTLKMCGRLDDDVLEAWAKGLKELKYLSLYAPYLVTFEQWKQYLGTFGGDRQLEGFGLMQSPRFDDDCIQVLVERNPQLYNLQLSELGKLTDTSLSLLHPLKFLTSLDISRAGVRQGYNLTDDAVVALLENCGETLVDLVLDQNYLLTDRVLIEGVKIHCPRLRSLSLHSLVELQSTGVQGLFTDWINTGLTHLNIHRCTKIENEALSAIISHSGHSLQVLNMHSVDEIEDHVLKELAQSAPLMEVLDLSFVRSVDDFVVKEILERMTALKVLYVHGDNRVSPGGVAGRAGVSIRGKENYAHIEL